VLYRKFVHLRVPRFCYVVPGTRFGESRLDGFNMVALLLPGVAVTYYGEEIGMVNTDIPFNETVGENIRTKERLDNPNIELTDIDQP
jgi:glycosidase